MEINAFNVDVLNVVTFRLLKLENLVHLQTVKNDGFIWMIQTEEYQFVLLVSEVELFKPSIKPLSESH
jgi:hypothetical protein